MAKLLYIIANPKKEDDSFCLTVGRNFINAYKKQNKNDEIIEIDVYKNDIQLIDEDVLNSWTRLQNKNSKLLEQEREKNNRMQKILDEFLSADKYVIASPMWNFSIPPMLKAYIDNIVIAGKTFKYSETGPIGLLENKKMLHIQASGGIYSDTPMDYANRYLSQIFKFMGVSSINSILIEGVNMFPDKAEIIKLEAIEKAQRLALIF